MPDLNIDTTEGVYINAQNALNAVQTLMRPRLRLYMRCAPAHQQRWRQADPLLNDVLTWSERIERGKGSQV